MIMMRAVAYHVPLSFIASAVPEEKDGIQFFRMENGVLAKRVHVWGIVVNKIVGDEYVRLTLDDLTGTVSVVFFDPLADAAREVEIGDTVDVVGRLRMRNDEVGIVGEVLKIVGPKVELLRRLENLAFVLGAESVEEVVPAPPRRREEGEKKEEEEEIEVETLDLEGDEW
ncbi:MAG: OB-fold nucleic acid binding domain [Candidatus Diapherotrites archaeon]|nr:OB-fold nucleic acid binding domain [Candidatus Diapherotrites archaeon]